MTKTETVSTERLADRMQLWFFRDLSDEQRMKLLRLCFYPATEFATHSSQQIAFRTLLSALETPPLHKEGEVVAAIELGDPEEWAAKFRELASWTGSAWIAGESDEDLRGDCYSFLCTLLGFMQSGEAAARALAAPVPVPVTITPTHRHKKRGTEYVLLGIGKMQAEHWKDFAPGNFGAPNVDMREVAIYRSATDPTEIWVRPREEFEDGRFEALSKPWEQG